MGEVGADWMPWFDVLLDLLAKLLAGLSRSCQSQPDFTLHSFTFVP